MSFRRDGKTKYSQQRDWAAWLASVDDLVLAVGLPKSILESEDSWRYFVDRTYSQAGYLGQDLWFDHSSLSQSQAEAFWQLLSRWLNDHWPDAPDYTMRSLEATYRPKDNR